MNFRESCYNIFKGCILGLAVKIWSTCFLLCTFCTKDTLLGKVYTGPDSQMPENSDKEDIKLLQVFRTTPVAAGIEDKAPSKLRAQAFPPTHLRTTKFGQISPIFIDSLRVNQANH